MLTPAQRKKEATSIQNEARKRDIKALRLKVGAALAATKGTGRSVTDLWRRVMKLEVAFREHLANVYDPGDVVSARRKKR